MGWQVGGGTLLERVVLNSGAGALIGLAASLVLSRGRARWAITFFRGRYASGAWPVVERSSAEMSAALR